ncbi:MAG: hypothetical protein OXI43_03605 [Candidatus Poribacteria bacterium]|nr:hypothetical protein [Candidatus Poribacteria bacterium]
MLENPLIDRLVRFFEAEVLNLYTSKPDKYELDMDSFAGVIKTTDSYFYKLDSSDKQDENIQIRFGYHCKKDGTPCIAVVLSDFNEFSEKEKEKWAPFLVDKSSLSQEDNRFKMWYDRYIIGSWEVKNGARKRLSSVIQNINACCETLVDLPLYSEVPDNSIVYPISLNTHAYEDAHQRLYGFLVDSLSRECLLEFVNLRNKTIPDAKNMRLPTLLRHVFCEFDKNSKLHTLLAEVSKQRSKSSHGVRDAAEESNAFENFRNDLEIAVEVYEELLELIESEFNVSSEHELRRHEIMEGLPKIVGDVESHYSICKSKKMEGKTVEKVWFGMREEIENVHQSEVLYVEFKEGEILAIELGANASDFLHTEGINPNELDVYFCLKWVPAPSNRNEDEDNSD